MKNLMKFAFIAVAFSFLAVSADSAMAQNRGGYWSGNNKQARKEYRREVRDARKEYRRDVREARRDYRQTYRTNGYDNRRWGYNNVRPYNRRWGYNNVRPYRSVNRSYPNRRYRRW